MNRKYMAGLLTGMFGALCLFALFFALYIKKTDNGSLVPEMTTSASMTQEEKDAVEAGALFDAKVAQIQQMINTYYYEEIDQNVLLEGAFRGMLDSLGDPYSTYYSEDEYNQIMESASGIYCGIGATISQNRATRIMTIIKPFVDSPSYKAGMLPGDVIYKVDGEDVTDKDLTEVVSKMKGPEATKVVVTVIREGVEEPIDLNITRGMVEVPTIEYEMMEDKIGYITIMEFDMITVEQFYVALDDLEKQGMKGLVIDLRDNPGGLLDAVVDMLDRMLPKGLLVYTEDKYGNRKEEFSTAKEEFTLPLTILINGNSASASEIFAGAIQDYGAGTIIGTQSFGKGIVQSLIPLKIDETAVKLTISHYFTPKGRSLHGEGVTPDILVELDEDLKKLVVIPKDKDNQLKKAISVLKDKMK